MMRLFRFLRLMVASVLVGGALVISTPSVFAQPVSYDQNFADHLLNAEPDAQGRVESVYNWGIDKNKTLIENVRALFYPDASGQGGKIYDLLRPIAFAILVLFLVLAGVVVVRDAGDGGKVKENLRSLLYIVLGGVIFFAATWILGVALNVDGDGGSQALLDNISNNLLFQILAFLKAFAFFVAVVMMIVYGYQMVSAMDAEDKLKKARQGIVNVLVALVLIKVIDFVYFIAQEQDFQSRATDFIITTAKVFLWLLGAAFTMMVIVAGFQLVVGAGKAESFNKLKSVATAILMGSIVIFMFLLIIYQVVQEFGV